MNIYSLFALPLCFCLTATAAESEQQPTSPHHWSGGVQFNSDYLMRGLSLSWHNPSPMFYGDYSHDSGWYAGAWAASVNTRVYNDGQWELGGYGGYSWIAMETLGINIGGIGYHYPGADSPTVSPQSYDTAEAYVAVSYGPFMAKYWRTLTDYWGVNGKNPWCWDTGCTPSNGDSRGSQYLEANLNFSLPHDLMLGLHAAHQWIAHYRQLDYSDYRITLDKSWGRWIGTLGYSTTTASETIYTYTSRGEKENIAEGVWFLRATLTF